MLWFRHALHRQLPSHYSSTLLQKKKKSLLKFKQICFIIFLSAPMSSISLHILLPFHFMLRYLLHHPLLYLNNLAVIQKDFIVLVEDHKL